jgi:hypothetical protein
MSIPRESLFQHPARLVYRASDTAGIYPADNVAAVIEVKAKLDAEKLRSAADNIAAAKDLVKSAPPRTALIIETPDAPFRVDMHTMGCVFAFERSRSRPLRSTTESSFESAAGNLGLTSMLSWFSIVEW